MSDLHFEFHRDEGREFIRSLPDCDGIIIAGDLTSPNKLEHTINLFCDRFKNVIYVLGNHEYYTSSFGVVQDTLSNIKNSNFKWLHRTVEVVDGFRFVGSTLWFGPSKAPKYMLNDFNFIHDFTSWVYEENKKDINFLKSEVQEGDIVVTHHLPAHQSVHPMYALSPLNPFFVCDVSDLITQNKPSIWIHGHTHTSCDYILDDTRVLCNPFGYLRVEENSRFKEEPFDLQNRSWQEK